MCENVMSANIFSIIPSNDRLPKWSKQLNICLNNIHSNSIQCLKWIVINEEKEGNDFLVFLCSGSLDEKIAFLQLLNL
ncbi:unnamed protein product [Meloidogyne enterolobii]|uniref:Uncharacterized protein n=1 Tax=Meloidogyne enterolobii TaxID=390850 RepID=A0ACB0ZTB4_MELEN